MLYSGNVVISTLAKRCLSQALSNTGANMSYLLQICDLSSVVKIYDREQAILYVNDKYANLCPCYSDDDTATAEMCIELIDMLDGLSEIDFLNRSDITEQLDFLCTQ